MTLAVFRNPTRLFGNFLIILSLASLLYVYLPILKQELFFFFALSSPSTPQSTEFNLTIPKLNISETVTANVDPFDPDIYQPILHHSVAHAYGSALPDQPGNIYLFAHSSDNPLSITRYNTAFHLLPKLNTGDQIIITYHGHDYIYNVRDKKIVSPWQLTSIITNDSNQLTLQTCYPIGTDWRRLLILADPVSLPEREKTISH